MEQPIGAALHRNLGSATAPGEGVESELDRFVASRHDRRIKSEGERTEEAAWRESERRAELSGLARNAAGWAEYHRGQADRLRATLDALIEHHETEAEKYLPKGA